MGGNIILQLILDWAGGGGTASNFLHKLGSSGLVL